MSVLFSSELSYFLLSVQEGGLIVNVHLRHLFAFKAKDSRGVIHIVDCYEWSSNPAHAVDALKSNGTRQYISDAGKVHRNAQGVFTFVSGEVLTPLFQDARNPVGDC